MKYIRFFWLALALGALALLTLPEPQPAHAYVEAPMSFGAIVAQSSHIVLMRVESVDRDKNIIIYRKVRDLKGVHPQEVIKHNIGRGGLRPNEWKPQMDWAEPGKMAAFFHNGGASETFIGNWWYQAYAGGEWWNHSHAEPFLLRSYSGPPDRLTSIIPEMLAGKEVVVACMVDGNKEDLHNRRAKIQRLKVSLKLQDYNPKRDFVGWGGEDFRRVNGMPGFTHISNLGRVDPEAQAISTVDFNGDNKLDVCLIGASKVMLLQNGGDAMSELSIPGLTGCRSAVWADYNGDGLPDLLAATTNGPKLFTNLGQGRFRDDSQLLPASTQPVATTAAVWLDYDNDGKPDILYGQGYHGLRLLKNIGAQEVKQASAPKIGPWHYCGPFDNPPQAFDMAHPLEKDLDLKREYDGKGGSKAVWKQHAFADGTVNNLALFAPQNNVNAAVYLYREIDCGASCDVPVSFGSDDQLTVWLNGKKILANNVARACAPDQDRAVLNLRAGKNQLLLRIGQGTGEWAFYFAAAEFEQAPPRGVSFEDVSAQVGLGTDGAGAGVKGDSLTVCDVNGDHRPDFLYTAGKGMLFVSSKNDGKLRYEVVAESGIALSAGKVAPLWLDYDGDGQLDLFVPHHTGCRLFKGDGKGRFADMSEKAGLTPALGHVTSAAWGDLDNDGLPDLVLGCLYGPNRFLRNRGDGTFVDASEAVGLSQKVFNTQSLVMLDQNGDGTLDLVLNNEGQESVIMLGAPNEGNKRSPVTIMVRGKEGVIGSTVRVVDKEGKTLLTRAIDGGSGRGGQLAPIAHFALPAGIYTVQVRYSSGVTRMREFTVNDSPIRGYVDEQAPEAKQP